MYVIAASDKENKKILVSG